MKIISWLVTTGLALVLLALVLWGCGQNTVTPPVQHTWTDIGTTLSAEMHSGGLLGTSYVIIHCTNGQVYSQGQFPNPFVVGRPVAVRDDGHWAKVGDEECRLTEED